MLVVLAAMLGLAWFWYDSLGAREAANAAALETCQGTGAMLLDGTVAFRRLQTVRVAGGALGFRRTYIFDYTRDGATRQQGFVVMTGHRVDTVGL
ncbi:MAG: DUF3301 domain-containing protein [Steroidobacteraceae bacterium]|nr:DUF3301 domain-containing protein [Steroidobacteraceae bacterium]